MGGNGRKILIVEDEPAHREAVRRAIEAALPTAVIRMATGIGEYRQSVASHPPDVVVIDMRLPDGRALEILSSPPEENPFPVVVMTGCGNEQVAVEAMRAGAMDYVVKSAEAFATLPRTIERTLREWEVRVERKRMLEALRESETRYRRLVENIGEGIWTLDESLHTTFVNQAMARMLGYSEHELCGIPLRNLLFEEDGELPFCGSRRRDDPRRLERRLRHRDGSVLWASISGSPIVDEAGTLIGTQIVVTDITDRRRALEEQQRLQSQIQRSKKLESLGALAGGIAHDFNNILLAILGNADLALKDLSDVSPTRTFVDEICQAARRAAELTRQLLAYSGKGRFDVRPLDLSELASEMAHGLRSAISKKTDLQMNLTIGLPAIRADAAQIQQVTMNLILNASESLDETRGGTVTVSTGCRTFDEEYLSRSHLPEKPPEGRYVFLDVSDTGCGMDEKTRERLFDPFFTTKFTGRGLGMPAVLGIVRGHEGAIVVDSSPGKGTAIRVLFPALDELAIPARDVDRNTSAWRGQGTVLLVDDERSIRDLGRRMLERMGFSVIVAADGVEALEVFRKQRDRITCIVLDLSMPRMDGEQALREIRHLDADVRVILSSGYSESELEVRFSGKGVAAFIQKPYQSDALRDVIRSVLGE